jgi:hypothetical protein
MKRWGLYYYEGFKNLHPFLIKKYDGYFDIVLFGKCFMLYDKNKMSRDKCRG